MLIQSRPEAGTQAKRQTHEHAPRNRKRLPVSAVLADVSLSSERCPRARASRSRSTPQSTARSRDQRSAIRARCRVAISLLCHRRPDRWRYGDPTCPRWPTRRDCAVSPASVRRTESHLVYTLHVKGRDQRTNRQLQHRRRWRQRTFPGDYSQSGATSYAPPSGTVTFGAGNSTAVGPSTGHRPICRAGRDRILTVTSGTGYEVGTPSVRPGLCNAIRTFRWQFPRVRV